MKQSAKAIQKEARQEINARNRKKSAKMSELITDICIPLAGVAGGTMAGVTDGLLEKPEIGTSKVTKGVVGTSLLGIGLGAIFYKSPTMRTIAFAGAAGPLAVLSYQASRDMVDEG
jgi:hypothetical protein